MSLSRRGDCEPRPFIKPVPPRLHIIIIHYAFNYCFHRRLIYGPMRWYPDASEFPFWWVPSEVRGRIVDLQTPQLFLFDSPAIKAPLPEAF